VSQQSTTPVPPLLPLYPTVQRSTPLDEAIALAHATRTHHLFVVARSSSHPQDDHPNPAAVASPDSSLDSSSDGVSLNPTPRPGVSLDGVSLDDATITQQPSRQNAGRVAPQVDQVGQLDQIAPLGQIDQTAHILIGEIRLTELLSWVSSAVDCHSVLAEDVMQPIVYTLAIEQQFNLPYIVDLFQSHDLEYLPVVDATGFCLGLHNRWQLFEWLLHPHLFSPADSIGHEMGNEINHPVSQTHDEADREASHEAGMGSDRYSLPINPFTAIPPETGATISSLPTSRDQSPNQFPQLSPDLSSHLNPNLSSSPNLHPGFDNLQVQAHTQIQALKQALDEQVAHNYTMQQRWQQELKDYKLLESKLYSSYMQVQALFDVMRDIAIIVTLRDDTQMDVSLPSAGVFTDTQLAEIAELTIEQFCDTPYSNEFQAQVRRALDRGELVEYEYQFVVGGETQWFEARISPLSKESVLWVARDVSAYKQSQAKLQQLAAQLEVYARRRAVQFQQTHEMLQTVLDAVPGCVVWFDQEGHCLGMNRHMGRMCNLSPDEVVGQPLEILGQVNRNDPFVHFLRRFLSSSDSMMGEVVEFYPVMLNWNDLPTGDRMHSRSTTQPNARSTVHPENLAEFEPFKTPPNTGFDALGHGSGNQLGHGSGDLSLNSSSRPTRTNAPSSHYFLTVVQRYNNDQAAVAISIDITDRLHAEASLRELNQQLEAKVLERTAKLQESETRYRAVVEDQTELICRLRPDGTLTFANPAYCRYFQLEEMTAVGQNLLDLVPPTDRPIFEQHLRALTQLTPDQPVFLNEYEFVNVDGQVIWQQWTERGIFNDDQQLIEIQAVGHDITERKLAEEALRTTQEQFRYLIVSNPAVIYTCDLNSPHLTKTFVGDNIRDILGYEAADWLADPNFWLMRLHPEDTAQVANLASQVQEFGHCVVEYRFLHQDGSYRWLRDELKRSINPDTQSVIEGIGSLSDISDRKRAEEEVLKALEKERELNELKSRFVSMASHEFRTPLAIIQSSAQLLERYHLDRDEQLEQLQQIQSSTQHMNQLIRDVLTLGRADAGQMAFNPQPVDLCDFCQTLVQQLQTTLHTVHHISLSIAPELAANPTFNFDQKLLRQILTNLISNAINYSPHADRVDLHLRDYQDWLQFQVQDYGIGVPPEDLPRLFESFHRASNVGTIQGTGLGLAIVQRCVSLHGGTINVSSRIGHGTTVTVRLPRQSLPTPIAG